MYGPRDFAALLASPDAALLAAANRSGAPYPAGLVWVKAMRRAIRQEVRAERARAADLFAKDLDGTALWAENAETLTMLRTLGRRLAVAQRVAEANIRRATTTAL